MTQRRPASVPLFSRLRLRWCWSLLGLLTLAWFGSVVSTSQAKRAHRLASKDVVISGVYFDGHLRGNPEPEEAIRLTNLHPTRTVDISGWVLSDRYFSFDRRGDDTTLTSDDLVGTRRRRRRKRRRRRRRTRRRRSKKDQPHNVVLPTDTTLAPGASLWVTHKGKAFYKVFGKRADVELVNTDEGIPDASSNNGWLNLYASRGIVSLHNSHGEAIDVVTYIRDSEKDTLDRSKIPDGHWIGKPVMLRWSNPYSWTGQILARDRDGRHRPTPDTNTAKDWDDSFSLKQLGADRSHRVERPGQSFFPSPRHKQVYAELLVTSAPENNYAALTKAFRRAKREILVNIYQFTNDRIADFLVAARKRGVKVTVLMEGAPVGGVRDSSRYIARRLVKAGAKVLWMRGIRKRKIIRRYRFNHAKYVILDRKWVIIGTENYGSTGHPVHPSRGNRGWEIHVRHPGIVKELLQVFRADTNTKRYRDLVPYRNTPGFRWGPPRKKNFRPKRKIKYGSYRYRRPPLRVRGKMDLELVLSPDSSLHERKSIIGSILSCRKEVLIQQNSVPLYWGKKKRRSFLTTPDLPLMAVIQAARKGCRVRVMLDSTWYHIRTDNKRSNDNTIWMLNHLARKEKLDLQAKLINRDSASIVKIHAKGVIVDRKETFVGSINWSENSFKGNREVGILVRQPDVARYYADLFMRDWIHTRLFRVVVAKKYAAVRRAPKSSARVLRVHSYGDPIDVLGEVGDFFQVRLSKRSFGYMRKDRYKLLFTPYEARFQVGRRGSVVGRIKHVKFRKKMTTLFFSDPVQRDLTVTIWNSTARRIVSDRKALRKKLLGRVVHLQGRITAYRGSPQLVIRRPSQIHILY